VRGWGATVDEVAAPPVGWAPAMVPFEKLLIAPRKCLWLWRDL
jgi:hypothetical protein